MGLIDTHLHLDSYHRRGELPEVLARARAADVEAVITIGTAEDDWSLYRDLAEASRGYIQFTVGLHPCSVGEDWAGQLSQVDAFFTDPGRLRPVAIGEMGLDRFHLPKDDAAASERLLGWQREAFDAGLALARRWQTPVVIHSRGAFRECVERVDASGVDWRRVVFHCFVEGPDEMDLLLERGGWASFTGVLTYKNAETVRAAARRLGWERFLLETDAPFLTPAPHRGKPNEPAYVALTAAFAADLFGIPLARLAEASTRNARQLFGFPAPTR